MNFPPLPSTLQYFSGNALDENGYFGSAWYLKYREWNGWTLQDLKILMEGLDRLIGTMERSNARVVEVTVPPTA